MVSVLRTGSTRAIVQIAFGVFANAKIQCEESVSSSTQQNCPTTNRVSNFRLARTVARIITSKGMHAVANRTAKS